ncbi:hypothetical protein C8Q79DRAFT_147163 [Trametes meyenii]|nr:hypothetical protein C8Q79DRAFT_147163 [Trametes meyenii]
MRLARTLLSVGGLYLNRVNGQFASEAVASWLSGKIPCPSDYAWTNNEEGHTPCEVAYKLLSQCENNPNVLGEFPNPDSKWQNIPCACNTVAYSLVYACTVLCLKNSQSAITQGQFQGQLVCGSNFASQKYPGIVPPGVGIPKWAYLKMDASDQFDVSQAQQVASSHAPDATAPGSYAAPAASPNTPVQPGNPSPSVNPVAPSNPANPTTASQSTPPTVTSQTPHITSTSSATQSAGYTNVTSSVLGLPTSRSPTGSLAQSGGGSHTPASVLADGSPSGAESIPATSSPTPASSASSSSVPTLGGTAEHAHAERSRSVVPIVCGVIGCLVAAVLAVSLALCIVRRRRLRREKEALIPGEWLTWRKPRADVSPSPLPAEHEQSECSTIAADDADDLETLQCGDHISKKSVVYGEYPD